MVIVLQLEQEYIIDEPFLISHPDVSEEEFEKFATEDIKCELLNGVLYIHSPANEEHEDIFGHLQAIIRVFFEEKGLGKVFGSRLVMRLSEKWNPEPDLLLIKPEKYKNLMNGRLYGPADLVIEILSKTTIETDLSKKLPEFLRCGVEEVWIINPIDRSIAVHSKDKVKKFLDPESEEIIASAAFPTFKLQVNWIWDRKTNPVMRIIKKLLE